MLLEDDWVEIEFPLQQSDQHNQASQLEETKRERDELLERATTAEKKASFLQQLSSKQEQRIKELKTAIVAATLNDSKLHKLSSVTPRVSIRDIIRQNKQNSRETKRIDNLAHHHSKIQLHRSNYACQRQSSRVGSIVPLE